MRQDIKRLIIYSAVMGLLLLPMLSLATGSFNGIRFLRVWGIIVGVLVINAMIGRFKSSGMLKSIFSHRAETFFANLRIKGGQTKRYIIIFLITVAAIFPQFGNSYHIDVAITCLVYICLGLGLNVVVGLCGLLDLGYIAFYATGAYCYSLLNLHFGIPFWFCIPIGIVVGVICGCIIGYPTLRMRGDYLAIVTLGFGEIIRIVLNNWDRLTKGPNGLMGMDKPALILPSLCNDGFCWTNYILDSLQSQYYLILLITALTLIGVHRLSHSRIGRAWIAIREDETAAELSGVPTTLLKLLAYATGAAFAAVAGAFYAAKLSYTNPNFFTLWESVVVLCIVVLGGAGSVPGVVVGAVIIIVVPEVFRELMNFRMLAFGLLMMTMVIVRPEGLIPMHRIGTGIQSKK